MKLSAIFLLFISTSIPVIAQNQLQTKNVILVTLDGMRWQEVFTGADSRLIANQEFVEDTAELKSLFWKNTPEKRREILMPFFWSTIITEGQLYGNRQEGSLVNVTNTFRFSYPGYNEILTGFADKNINSNDKIPNPNKTVLEIVNQRPDFRGRVAAFGSWDVFPYIINEERSNIPVNAGYEIATGNHLSPMEELLNKLQPVIPGHWSSVRMDAFTHYYALEHLKKKDIALMYISYGETDDFAHDGKYDAYLKSALRTDQFIQELWSWVQSDERYKNSTTLLITTDHGRGTNPLNAWQSHGEDVDGADEIWMAVLGPDIATKGLIKGQFYQNQIAKTIAALLNIEYNPEQQVGRVIAPVIKEDK